MQREALDRAWQTMRRSAFRMETLQTYAVPQEDPAWRAFNEGQPLPRRTPDNNPWLRRVAGMRSAGQRLWRVHVVDIPLSRYVQFELEGYQDNAAAGEEIYIAERNDDLADLTSDWWLFDDTRLVLMDYSLEGVFLGATDPPAGTDISEYVRRRDRALQYAEPLGDYLSREHSTK